MRRRTRQQQNRQVGMVEQKTPINDLSMLFTSEFSDELLKNCLNQGKIKASEKP